MKGRRLSRRRAGRAQMCAPRLHPGCGKRCYRDQSQNPLNEDAASRALARPTGLRASFAAAARAFQSSCRSSRQKKSFPRHCGESWHSEPSSMPSSCGDESATSSLAPGRVAAFSGADAGTSLPAGAAFEACVKLGVSAGGAAAAGASLRPNGSRAIAGLSTAFRIRTMRALGAMAEAGADVSLDVWADTSADACGRAAVAA